MEGPTGYIQVPSDRLPTSRQPQHTAVVYPNVSWRVSNCRPVLTTGRSALDRQCNSLPAEHIPIVRLSHPESMRFSTGRASLGMASPSSSRFQKTSWSQDFKNSRSHASIFKDLMISRFQDVMISIFQDLMVSRSHDFKISRTHAFKIWRSHDFKIARVQGFQIAWFKDC